MLNIFDLERNGPIPFHEWDLHPNRIPLDIWNIIQENRKEGYPILIGLREDTGYYVLSSGQGPFVVWMEKPQQVDGPHPYNPKQL